MIMANSNPFYEYQLDDHGFASHDNDDEPVDLVSLFNTIGEKCRGDYSENGLADPSSSTIPCSELASYGVNEHFETNDGSLAFPSLHYYSEASTSRNFCSSESSVTGRQTINFGYEKLEVHQEAFPADVSPWLETNAGTQDLLSLSKHAIKQAYLERANNNGAFGLSDYRNDNHQLMDNYGITDETFDESDGNSYLTLEFPPQSMDLSMYSDSFYDLDPSDKFSVPFITSINEPYNFGSDDTVGTLFNNKSDIEELLMQDISINSVVNYKTTAERPGGIVLLDQNSDVGPYVSAEGNNTCLPSGESSLGKLDKESTSGFHGLHRCNMANRTQTSTLGAPLANMRKNAKLETVRKNAKLKNERKSAKLKSERKNAKLKPNDEKSGHQAPLQNHQCNTTLVPAQTSTLGAPLTNMRKNAKLKNVRKKLKPNDEKSGHQAPLQNHQCNTTLVPVQTSTLGAPLTNMRKNAKLKNVRKKLKPNDEKSGHQAPLQNHQCNTTLVPVQTSTVGAPLTYKRKNAKLQTSDEKSGHQAPLQENPQRKPEIPLQNGGLAIPLLKHQRIALSWMTRKETKSRHCCGGILADDQGLGKTISSIALILKERSPPSAATKEKQTETLTLDEEEDVISHTNIIKTSLAGGTLVVCPTSVLHQWNEELHNKVTNESSLSVLIYHGRNRTDDPIEVSKYDVVLTTYAIVSMEVPKQPLVEQEDGQSQTKLSTNKKRKYKHTPNESSNSESVNWPLAKLRWFRVILDEAQSIKNYKTQVARACWGLRAKRRWCLSGTPIQNSVDDLYSYFRFLRYDPFSVFKTFCSHIKAPIQRDPVSGYKRLQLILKTIMLRRTKRTLVKGEPIISLPPKTITLKKVDFTDEERGFYRSLEAESRAQFKKYAAAGTVNQNYINILWMLLRLRQACDHPLLVKECSLSTNRSFSVEKTKELPEEKLRSLLNCLEASLAICGICNDPPEDAAVTTCEHVFCNQCIMEHLSSDDNQCPSSECKKILTRSSVFCKSTLSVSSGSLESESCSIDSSRIEPTFKPLDSTKIKAVLQVLQSISKPKGTLENSVVREKAIIFSQWTRMLDLLEVCLKDSSIDYRRFDGTMSVGARDKAVKDFNTLPEVSVMIMSLKAASLGLNMVAACHVILLDLWWNPTTEDQAIDRAHRIGQTRPVTVLRLTVKDTVEDRILALQEKKREMVESAFGDEDNGGSQTRLTIEDMRYLFQA